jgi:hypothetical protein
MSWNRDFSSIENLSLQHYGAATGLVDFSRDFLIALWFAAHDNKGKNGKVFVLNINNIDKFSELQKGGKIFDKHDTLQEGEKKSLETAFV